MISMYTQIISPFICRMRILLFVSIALLASCSPVSMVKPLQKKQWAATATVGGPLVGFGGAVVPVPFTSVGAAYGVDSVSTLALRVHTTAALFGVGQIDGAYLRQWRGQEGGIPGISTVVQATYMVDRWEGNSRFYPSLDVNAWWDVGKKGSFIYTGITSWYELKKIGTADRVQEHRWIPALNLGYTRSRGKWNTNFECKYLAPFTSHESLTVDYKAPGSNGAFGVYVGFTRKFGKP